MSDSKPSKKDNEEMESEDDDQVDQDLEDRVFPSFQVLTSLVGLLVKQEVSQTCGNIPTTTEMLGQVSTFISQLAAAQFKQSSK